MKLVYFEVSPLNAELNPICHLLALVGAHHILHVNRVRVRHPVVLSCSFYVYKQSNTTKFAVFAVYSHS